MLLMQFNWLNQITIKCEPTLYKKGATDPLTKAVCYKKRAFGALNIRCEKLTKTKVRQGSWNYVDEIHSSQGKKVSGNGKLFSRFVKTLRKVAVTFFVLRLSLEGFSILRERVGYFSHAPFFRVVSMTLKLEVIRSFRRLNGRKFLPEPPAFTDLQTKWWNSASNYVNVMNYRGLPL